jgi:phosphoglycerate dehydrogenase-like enzyme
MGQKPSEPFRVGITGDFKTRFQGVLEPVLHEYFDPLPHVQYEFLSEYHPEVKPEQLRQYDGVITLKPRFTGASFAGVDRLAVIARWGVGYDMIDVPACTDAGVLLGINTDAVRRPVAEAIVTFVLALAKRLPAKDRLVREGRWEVKASMPGLGLTGKTVGTVGVGNIGAEMFRLLEPFDLGRKLAFDPYVAAEDASALGVELVDLSTVFRESDFVAINCPLNDRTRGMVDVSLIGLMKPTAYLVNTARGAIIKQSDLVAALEARAIAGAGLDVFEEEPLPTDHPLTRLDNVILAPHALAWTDQIYRGNSVGACENVLSVLRGEIPRYTVNREVVERPGFQRKLAGLRERWAALAT